MAFLTLKYFFRVISQNVNNGNYQYLVFEIKRIKESAPPTISLQLFKNTKNKLKVAKGASLLYR